MERNSQENCWRLWRGRSKAKIILNSGLKKKSFINKNFNSNVNFLHTIQFLNFTKISNLLSSTPYQNSSKSLYSAPAERETTPILKRKKKNCGYKQTQQSKLSFNQNPV